MLQKEQLLLTPNESDVSHPISSLGLVVVYCFAKVRSEPERNEDLEIVRGCLVGHLMLKGKEVNSCPPVYGLVVCPSCAP